MVLYQRRMVSNSATEYQRGDFDVLAAFVPLTSGGIDQDAPTPAPRHRKDDAPEALPSSPSTIPRGFSPVVGADPEHQEAIPESLSAQNVSPLEFQQGSSRDAQQSGGNRPVVILDIKVSRSMMEVKAQSSLFRLVAA